jgi:ubiquinone/menaquinone biosynthesis C-methylase UbiE
VVGALEDEIFDFLEDHGAYWGEISQSAMQDLLSIAAQSDWRTAFHDMVSEHPQFYDYLLNPTRIDWLFHCLDATKTERCLDIGSGWGSLTFELAAYFDTVWSLEAVEERIQLQRIRAGQDRIKNVRFARANWLSLPFPDDYFDLVVANGVLEWVGISEPSRNPRDVQIAFLSEVYRTLKPGGCLYIGIENRFGMVNLRGGRDHSGLRFTSIVPRWLADWMVRAFRHKDGAYREEMRMAEQWEDYRTYTYSQRGYKRLLEDAGYQRQDLYWTFTYNNPKYAGPCDGESFAFLLKRMYRSRHWLPTFRFPFFTWPSYLPSPVQKLAQAFLAPCFLIYAYKARKGTTLEAEALDVDSGASSFLRMSGDYLNSSKVNYFLLKHGKVHSVIKFPRHGKGTESLIEEEACLERFNPAEIRTARIGQLPLFVEPSLDGGQPPHPYSLEDNLRILDWLLNFQSQTEQRPDGASVVAQRVADLERLVQQLPITDQVNRELTDALGRFLDRLEMAGVASTAQHGDFWIGNISTLEDGTICVVDWECYQELGGPFTDLAFFLLQNCSFASYDAFHNNLVGKGPYSFILREVVHRFALEKQVVWELVLDSFPYTLLDHIGRAIESQGIVHPNVEKYSKQLAIWSTTRRETFEYLAQGNKR